MNLNDLAKRIAEREGKSQQVSIAQIKEIMRLIFEELSELGEEELEEILERYRSE